MRCRLTISGPRSSPIRTGSARSSSSPAFVSGFNVRMPLPVQLAHAAIDQRPQRLHQVVGQAEGVGAVGVEQAQRGQQARGHQRPGHGRPDNGVAVVQQGVEAARRRRSRRNGSSGSQCCQ